MPACASKATRLSSVRTKVDQQNCPSLHSRNVQNLAENAQPSASVQRANAWRACSASSGSSFIRMAACKWALPFSLSPLATRAMPR